MAKVVISNYSLIQKKKEMKFRKKPIEVDAMQLFKTDFEFAMLEKQKEDNHIVSFCHQFMGASVWLSKSKDAKVRARIKTLEGNMEISDGDWLIKGVNGEYYPCKPDIFEKIYEPIKK